MHQDRSTRIVARWIFIGIAMLIIQVLLGGITRLTGSGLSITEWKPLMGAMPPSGESEWQVLFVKYQQIAQYKYLNQHFTLSDFKFIFFWEWFHRQWARLIGIAFLLPFIYFLVKGYFKKWMVAPLVILFVLGALQGAVGWIMVKSGLNDNDLYVSHIRLAAHFLSAMVLICYAWIFGLKLTAAQDRTTASPTLQTAAITITALLFVQLMFGAFMAGLKAANVAPTWPDINGAMLPTSLSSGSFLHNAFHDKITIHFIHRTLAYILTIAVVILWVFAKKTVLSSWLQRAMNASLVLVVVQVILGISSVVTSPGIKPGQFGVFEWTAQLHQLTGMLLLMSLVAVVYLNRSMKAVGVSKSTPMAATEVLSL